MFSFLLKSTVTVKRPVVKSSYEAWKQLAAEYLIMSFEFVLILIVYELFGQNTSSFIV